MKKNSLVVLLIISILSCSGAEEQSTDRATSSSRATTSLLSAQTIIAPKVNSQPVPKAPGVSPYTLSRANQCIAKEYRMSRVMFCGEDESDFEDQKRLTPQALDALREKSSTTRQSKNVTSSTAILEYYPQSMPLEVVKDEYPD